MRVFAWLMVLNKILTVDNLMRCGSSMVNRCVLCKNSSESVLHLFEQCQVSVQVYTQAAQALHMVIPITGAIREITENNYNAKTRAILLIAQFVIWRERCTRIFRDISKQKEQLVHEIVTEYQLQERTQVTSTANVDAHCRLQFQSFQLFFTASAFNNFSLHFYFYC